MHSRLISVEIALPFTEGRACPREASQDRGGDLPFYQSLYCNTA